MRKNDTRDVLLNAAERVVMRDGASRLTLDMVGREASVSKGGVLYHFPTKNALIAAMLDRLTGGWEDAQMMVAASDPDPFGRRLRAYVRTSGEEVPPCAFSAEEELSAPPERVAAGLLAAMANEPDLLNSVRERMYRWQQEFTSDGLSDLDATLIRLAIDGLWFQEMYQIAPPTGELRERLITRLLDLTRGSDATSANDTTDADERHLP